LIKAVQLGCDFAAASLGQVEQVPHLLLITNAIYAVLYQFVGITVVGSGKVLKPALYQQSDILLRLRPEGEPAIVELITLTQNLLYLRKKNSLTDSYI
jgi:hypothetical protein